MATHQHHSYCAMCVSRCGVIASVEDGVLKNVVADPAHPNGCICVKGTAAPEIVYSPDRLRYPMKRTRPKGDKDPGWVRISWDEAMELTTTRLTDAKSRHGAESIVIGTGTSSGSGISDAARWVERLANGFGTPNFLAPVYNCNWNREWGAHYTYGVATPLPDYDNAQCIILWGFNPFATWPAAASRISKAKARGAKLIVIDPRRSNTVERADLWLQVRPGTDGVLALSMIHVMLEESLFDPEFVRQWSNGPFLVRADNQQLLTESDLRRDGDPKAFFIWDERNNESVSYRPDRGYARADITPALSGVHRFTLENGAAVECRPAFDYLAATAAQYAPEICERITGVPANDVRRAVRMMIAEKPSCYYSWVGIELHDDATQTNRALCILYALTGQFDQRGSNVIFANVPVRPVTGDEFLPEQAVTRRLGYVEYPLGSPGYAGRIQAAHLYRAILEHEPYPIKAVVSFGGDLLMAHADSRQAHRALRELDFYAHVDIVANPSSSYADLLLPASTCWEREGLASNFTTAEETAAWVQLRPAVVEPQYESRADLEIVFELAKRLGLNELFFNGEVDAGYNWQLAPTGLTVKDLREQRIGLRAAQQTRHRKYAETEEGWQVPRGFRTPTRKLEIFSTKLAQAGFAPFPGPFSSASDRSTDDYPLVLTSFRLVQFCDQQHRNIPRLRKQAREPLVEMHPTTAQDFGIREHEWVRIETAGGAIRLKAKLNQNLARNVVAAQHGWWQGCTEPEFPGYDPLSAEGANLNLILSLEKRDPISGAVAHRSQRCRVRPDI